MRIDSVLVKKARYLAIDKDQPVSEVLSDLLRPVIEREYRKWEKEHLKEDKATKAEPIKRDEATKGKAEPK